MKKFFTYLSPIILIALAVGFLIWSQPVPKTPLSIHTPEHTYNLLVEIARTPAEKEQGLMGRPQLPEDEGMLFVYDVASNYTFWMKNMKFPLDLIFLASDHTIIEMNSMVPPCTTIDELCPRYTPNHPARYVMELQGGFAQKYGLQLGDNVSWEE